LKLPPPPCAVLLVCSDHNLRHIVHIVSQSEAQHISIYELIAVLLLNLLSVGGLLCPNGVPESGAVGLSGLLHRGEN
jgi:hypothetical protein